MNVDAMFDAFDEQVAIVSQVASSRAPAAFVSSFTDLSRRVPGHDTFRPTSRDPYVEILVLGLERGLRLADCRHLTLVISKWRSMRKPGVDRRANDR